MTEWKTKKGNRVKMYYSMYQFLNRKKHMAAIKYTIKQIQDEATEKFTKNAQAYAYFETLILRNEIQVECLKSFGHLREIIAEVIPLPPKKVIIDGEEHDMPKPIFTARYDNPQDMEILKKVFHRESLEKAFGEGGGGMDEILDKLEKAKRGEI